MHSRKRSMNTANLPHAAKHELVMVTWFYMVAWAST